MFMFKKKKKLVLMSLEKALLSYRSYEQIIKFINVFWRRRKLFIPGYYLIDPALNPSQKWRFDYTLLAKNKPSKKKKKRRTY